MREPIKNYRDLEVWQEAMDLSVEVYRATGTFPKEETYGITAQIRRAGISVPSNIAEGWARIHRKEYVQFLGVALGSLAEVDTLTEISSRLGFLEKDAMEDLNSKIGRLRAKTLKLLASLK